MKIFLIGSILIYLAEQVTSINDSMSYPLSMPIGVPRVSTLGRLLFIVYVRERTTSA